VQGISFRQPRLSAAAAGGCDPLLLCWSSISFLMLLTGGTWCVTCGGWGGGVG
jgi:hypothetical protein